MKEMTPTRTVITAVLLMLPATGAGQSYRVYTEHPRLWLNARHLRLLKRERERSSIRWQQLELLRNSGQRLPEQPLVDALRYQVAGDKAAGRQAASWAVGRSSSKPVDVAQLRQMAVVFDWCYPVFSEVDRARVAAAIASGIAASSGQRGMRPFSATVLASIALAEDWPGSEGTLKEAFEKTWRETMPLPLRDGTAIDDPADRVALMEMCHAVRDNLNLDIWEQMPGVFKQFPIYLVLQYYPEPIVVRGQQLRQPATRGRVKADPAILGEQARIAELLTAAYDTSSVEAQFLQGWLTHEIYRLRTPSGALYEFLWMNPYQPGLSYYSAPLHLYDEAAGRLWARSSWDDDAIWIAYSQGELQLFAGGERSVVDPAVQARPIVLPHLAVMPARGETSFRVHLTEGDEVYIVGLQAGKTYWVKTGDRPFAAREAARGGILALHTESGVETAFEIKASDPTPPPAPEVPRKKKR